MYSFICLNVFRGFFLYLFSSLYFNRTEKRTYCVQMFTRVDRADEAIIDRRLDEIECRRRDNCYTNKRTGFIILAFIGYDDDIGRITEIGKDIVGHWQHVEIWFPLTDGNRGMACSVTQKNGVYFKTRYFTDEKYEFYRIETTQQEQDEMFYHSYRLRGRGFDSWNAYLLVLPAYCACLRNLCCLVKQEGFMCSQLIFCILYESGLLDRLLHDTEDWEFTDRIAATVTTTELYEVLESNGVMSKCPHQMRGIPQLQAEKLSSRGQYGSYYTNRT